jgi:hypothetical protein
MKIDFDQKFINVGENSPTLGFVSVHSLNSLHPDQQGRLPLEDHVRRGNLALTISNGGKIDMSVDDLALIRQQLPLSGFTPIVVAQAAKMLEGAGDDKHT